MARPGRGSSEVERARLGGGWKPATGKGARAEFIRR